MRLLRPLLALVLPAALLAAALRAQTHATWTGATDSNWTTSGTNWTPMNIPNGSSDTATFDASSGPNAITVSTVFLNTLTFTSDALANTFTVSNGFNFLGTGIVNHSSTAQTIINNGANTSFRNYASAGSIIFINNHTLTFGAHATAGTSTITNHGTIQFNDGNNTAGSATVTNHGTINFYGSFMSGSTAGSATIANHGTINFYTHTSGGSAAVTNDASAVVVFHDDSINSNSLGSLAGGGTVQLNATRLTIGSLNTSTTFDGVITDGQNWSGGLIKTGTGTLTLTNPDNRFYHVQVDGGTLALTNGATIGYYDDSAITVNAGGTLDLGGGTVASSSATLNGGTLKNGTITGYYSPFAFDSGTVDATLAGGVSLVKYTADTLTLNGVNTYAGNTDIAAGTLILNGSLADGATYIWSGATLGGSGVFHAGVQIGAGATLAPGNSAGTLTFAGGLELVDGATLDLELGAISDLILVTGGTFTSAHSAGGITLNLSDAGGFAAGTYTLLDYSALASGDVIGLDLADFTLGSVISGYDFSLDLFADTLRLTATASAIPEPSTYAALLGALVLGLALHRRRRRNQA